MRTRPALAVFALALLGIATVVVGRRSGGSAEGEGEPRPAAGVVAGPPAPPSLAASPRARPAASPAAPAATSDAPFDAADRPAGWPTDLRTARLRVTCVDATTGHRLEVPWQLVHLPGSSLVRADDADPSRQPTDPRRRAASSAGAVHVDAHAQLGRVLHVELPPGYVRRGPELLAGGVAAGAEDLEVVVPLHPTIELVVTIRGPDGAPASGARLTALTSAGGAVPLAPPAADATGVVRVPNLAFVPGARVTAFVVWRPASAPPRVPPPSADLEEVEQVHPPLRVEMPGDRDAPFRAEVVLAGPTDGDPEPLVTDRDLPTEEPLDPRTEDAPERAGGDLSPVGAVRGRALAYDGSPLPRVLVGCGPTYVVTDGDGRFEFRRVPVGAATLRLDAPGRLAGLAIGPVRADEVSTIVLQEPRGGRLDVRVVDAAGRPRPFAELALDVAEPFEHASLAFDLDGVTQRLDPYADVDGRRSYARVAPGRVTVAATWGDRAGSETVDVADGVRTAVRVVVP